MAPRPELYPLKTPSDIIFPSELQEYLRSIDKPEPTRCSDPKGPSVPPPLAYTEFLKALSPTFGSPSDYSVSASPSFGKQLPSPQSLPSCTSTSSFPGDVISATRSRAPSNSYLPLPAPRSAGEASQFRRLRKSPTYFYSYRGNDSPKSAHAVRSPYPPVERRVRYMDSPTVGSPRSITVQHIVTHTVTLKRVPSLDPPPKGKRRRANQTQK
ncbi:uncharacterized protein BJX67DRAFT_362608 [Aspergillus lucknowensis]|uniref:Uncharacterized protein n=1 Tax=Aspergillus lucknowensis TaxID=176173 RepID=A0ABR4LGW7_9EURO